MDNIVVIEICDRSLCSVTPCDSMEDAISAANDLLKTHCNQTGYGDELEEAVQEAESAGCIPGGVEFRLASADNDNAWCNYGDRDWDAFIVEF